MMSTTKIFQNFIINYLNDLNSNTKNNQPIKSPIKELTPNEVNSSDFFYNLIAFSPEYLFSKIGKRIKEHKNQAEIWNPTKVNNSFDIEGILSCHALSPMGDSVFLLADLGRTMRTGVVLKKDVTIMLADRDWSEYNWVAKDLGPANLTRSFTWRKSLYKKIGVILNSCNLHNISNEFTKDQIEEIGTAYEDLVRSIFGSEYVGRKLSKEEANELHYKYKLYSKTEDSIDFLNISLVKEKMKPEKEVIFNLLQTLRQFDQDTFIYYFTQRFHQYKYDKFLKIAVRSEKNFDKPFFELDKVIDKKGVNFAIYYENYKMYDDTFVIPYYFPSGSLYEDKSELESYFNQTIMLNDNEDEEKITKLFNKMNYPYSARLISDLMSFTHFLLFPLNNNNNQSEFRTRIKKRQN